MCGNVFVNARRAGRDQRRVSPFVAVARVARDDHNRASSFCGRIGRQLNESNTAAQRALLRRRRSGAPFGIGESAVAKRRELS